MTTFALAMIVLAIFIWLITPSHNSGKQLDNVTANSLPRHNAPSQISKVNGTACFHETSRNLQIGAAVGAAGGDISDAATARFALDRLPSDADKSSARTLGNAIGLVSGLNESSEIEPNQQ